MFLLYVQEYSENSEFGKFATFPIIMFKYHIVVCNTYITLITNCSAKSQNPANRVLHLSATYLFLLLLHFIPFLASWTAVMIIKHYCCIPQNLIFQ